MFLYLHWNTSINFHTRVWSPSDLLRDVSHTAFLPKDEVEYSERLANLWQGLCSESDASALQQEIGRRGILVSDDAKQYIDLWSRDEQRHADGFVLLLEILCGLKPDVVRKRLLERPHDFSAINQYVVDEFTLLTIIAFDEIATCRGYSRDRDFYAGLGSPAFLNWIKNTVADEVTHATNAVRVIHKHHSARLGELDSVLDRWIGSATSHQDSRGTFLMDSLDLGYFKDDFPDFRRSLAQLFQNPGLLEKGAGKIVTLS